MAVQSLPLLCIFECHFEGEKKNPFADKKFMVKLVRSDVS